MTAMPLDTVIALAIVVLAACYLVWLGVRRARRGAPDCAACSGGGCAPAGGVKAVPRPDAPQGLRNLGPRS